MKKREKVAHYVTDGIECIEAMKVISTPEEFQGYLRLTALKYLWRLGKKDASVKEAKKALDYITWLHAELSTGTTDLPLHKYTKSKHSDERVLAARDGTKVDRDILENDVNYLVQETARRYK